MRKIYTIVLLSALFLMLVAFHCFADQGVWTALAESPASSQVTCNATATLLYAPTPSGTPYPYGRLSITFQNQGSQAVYIAPRADISTSNAGILLTQYNSFTADRANGTVAWYCITSTSTATVGVTEER